MHRFFWEKPYIKPGLIARVICQKCDATVWDEAPIAGSKWGVWVPVSPPARELANSAGKRTLPCFWESPIACRLRLLCRLRLRALGCGRCGPLACARLWHCRCLCLIASSSLRLTEVRGLVLAARKPCGSVLFQLVRASKWVSASCCGLNFARGRNLIWRLHTFGLIVQRQKISSSFRFLAPTGPLSRMRSQKSQMSTDIVISSGRRRCSAR